MQGQRTMTEEIAKDLASVKAGDTVWYFNAHANKHDADGKYTGRGVWLLAKVDEVNKLSVVVNRAKFNRATGYARAQNGYSSGFRIAGTEERDAIRLQNLVWQFDMTSRLRNATAGQLRQIFTILGIEH